MGRVETKVVLVTGGANGVGKDDVLMLAHEGAHVVITDLDVEAGQALDKELGGAAIFVKHDISREEDWSHAMAQTMSKFGRLDAVVNNAAIFPRSTIEEATLEQWRTIMRINADGYFLGCQAAVKAMKGNTTPSSIVNMSSMASLIGMADFCAYGASKGAVNALTRSVAVHCRSKGYRIRCNSIAPDGIMTPNVLKMIGDVDPAYLGYEANPATRLSAPRDIASTVLFLVSDESRMINGIELRVDNGLMISAA